MDGNLQGEDFAATLLLDADGNFRFFSVLTSPPFFCPELMGGSLKTGASHGGSSKTGASRGVDDSGTSILTAFFFDFCAAAAAAAAFSIFSSFALAILRCTSSLVLEQASACSLLLRMID